MIEPWLATPHAYLGVGSRESPPDILALMRRIASALARLGWALRTGGAPGADTAFEEGARVAGGRSPSASHNDQAVASDVRARLALATARQAEHTGVRVRFGAPHAQRRAARLAADHRGGHRDVLAFLADERGVGDQGLDGDALAGVNRVVHTYDYMHA